jgi:prepilin peptidase CpaA
VSIDLVTAVVILLVGSIACVTDIRWRRIPNALTLGAAATAVLYHSSVHGMSGLWFALGGWGVGLLLFLPFFLLRGMGGGDVKLLAALGAWVGPGDAVYLAIYTSLAGGVLAVGVALSRNYLGTALRNLKTMMVSWWLLGPRPVPAMTLEDSKAPRLAYAVPVLIGTMVTIWLR